MHCNLRPPDVTPVILSFKCKAHNAPRYKILQPPCTHDALSYTGFQQNPTIRYWVTGEWTNFPGTLSGRVDRTAPSLGRHRPMPIKQSCCFRFQISDSTSKRGRLKREWGGKWRPNLRLFDPSKDQGRDGRDVWVNKSRSIYSQTSGIIHLMGGRCAVWEFRGPVKKGRYQNRKADIRRAAKK